MDTSNLLPTKGENPDTATLDLVLHHGNLPDDVRGLRERVLRDETRFLSDAEIESEDDKLGTHFCLYEEGFLVGAALGLRAEESSFPIRLGMPPERVRNMFYATRLMVAPERRSRGLTTLLIYALFREARILDCQKVVAFMGEEDAVASRITHAVPLRGVTSLKYTGYEGRELSLHAVQADVNYAMYQCWRSLRAGLRSFVADRLLADEVIRTVLRLTTIFYDNPWFERVSARTLTRGQYVEFLANNHQFVRWTTRILARVAGLAADSELRKHYLHHLSGEIDHEKLIERDLAYLGADVEYVRNHMSPCVDIGHFMGVQESIVGFRADPYLLLAVPIAIESLTAHLSDSFLVELEANVRDWGFDEPSNATTYLRSHIPLDGGEDGHWERTGQAVSRFLKTEPDTQRFVGVVRMVIVAIDRALRSYVKHPDFA
jgi:GNAT superfamily N-acetyltransferase